MGLVQLLVFSRVLTPDRFSIYIVLGGIGYSLWLCDLGLAKVLFVKLRAARLAGTTDPRAAAEASAVILFYVLLALGGSLVCFAAMAARPLFSLFDAADFALFFCYVALNLAWFTLRSVSISVDQYLFYEKLELVRRVGNIATMLAMLIGLPFTVFLIGSNALWAALLTAAAAKLIRCGALAPRVRGFPREIIEFFRLQQHLDRPQRHLRLERSFHLHVSLLRRAGGVRPRRAGHHSRADIPHLSRRRHDLCRRLRPRDPRTDPRARRPRCAAARPHDPARGGAVRRSGEPSPAAC